MDVPLRAWLLDSTVDLAVARRLFSECHTVGPDTLLIQLDPAHQLWLTRFGALVFWPYNERAARDATGRLRAELGQPALVPEVEDRLLVVTHKGESRVLFEEIWVAGAPRREEQLVIAQKLAQSVALERMEIKVDGALQRFQGYMGDLASVGRLRVSQRVMLRTVGFAMQTRHAVLNDLALLDRPDVTWEMEDMERLDGWLREHFELEERLRSIGRKLDFIAHNTSLLLEVLSTRRGLRLEWTIVILLVLDIALFGVLEILRQWPQ